jgi:hypothetical protein
MTDRFKWAIVIFFLTVVLALGAMLLFSRNGEKISTYEDCITNGGQRLAGLTRTCIINGRSYSE